VYPDPPDYIASVAGTIRAVRPREDRGCYDWDDDGGMSRLKPFAKWVTSWVPDSSSVNSSDKVPFRFRCSSVGSSGGYYYR